MAKRNSALDAFAAGFARLMIKLRWLVVILSVAGAGYAAQGLTLLTLDNDYRAFFSEENPELQNFENFEATYTKSDNLIFVLEPKNGESVFTVETLSAVAELTERAWQTPYVLRVDSLTNFQYTYAEEDDLIVDDLVPDPGALSEAELAEKRRIALDEPLLKNLLVSEQGGAAAVNVVLQYPDESLDEVPISVAFARALRDEIETAYPGLNVYLSGKTMLNNAFSEAAVADFGLLYPLMFALIVATTLLVVRSVGATLATIVIIILSSVVAMGVAGFYGVRLAGPSPSAPIVILTLAIADSMHILMSLRTALRKGFEKNAAIVEAVRVNFLAVSITSITTIVGFLALNFSDSPPFRDFGNIIAVGILAAWVYSLTLLPALLALTGMKPQRAQASEGRGSILGGFATIVIKHYRFFFILFGAASAYLIAFIPSITLSDNMTQYFDERVEFRQETDKIIPYFGYDAIEFSVPAAGPGGVNDPEYLKTIDAFADWLERRKGVRHVYSIADVMKRLNKNLNADDPAYYRLPENRERAAQYLLLYELSLPMGLDLNDRINIDKSTSRVTAMVDGNIETSEVRVLVREADEWFAKNAPETEVVGTGAWVLFTFIAQRNVESMVEGTLIAIAAIALIMVLSLRSVTIGLVSMAPNALPILAAFGVWALTVNKVGLSVSSVAAISLGIVIDDTVHFLTKYMRARRLGLAAAPAIRYSFETVGLAILVNTMILAIGFAVLTQSSFQVIEEMGMLTTITIVFALILDFFFLPALLLIIARAQGETISADGVYHDEKFFKPAP